MEFNEESRDDNQRIKEIDWGAGINTRRQIGHFRYLITRCREQMASEVLFYGEM